MKVDNDGNVTFTSNEMVVVLAGIHGMAGSSVDTDIIAACLLVKLPGKLRELNYVNHLATALTSIADGGNVGIFE